MVSKPLTAKDKSRGTFFNYFFRRTHLVSFNTAWYFLTENWNLLLFWLLQSLSFLYIFDWHLSIPFSGCLRTAVSIEFSYFYSSLIKKNISCPKFHSKHRHGDKVLERGMGGWGQQKCLNGLRWGVSARGPQGEEEAAMAWQTMMCCSVFWYSDSHLRPLSWVKVHAWVGVWKFDS